VQAVLNLASVVAGSAECREEALLHGALPKVADVLRLRLPPAMGSGVLRAAMSATYALLIGSPRPASNQAKHALHQLLALARDAKADQILVDVAWTLNDIVTQGGGSILDVAMAEGMGELVAKLVVRDKPTDKLLTPSLKLGARRSIYLHACVRSILRLCASECELCSGGKAYFFDV
jgi:hypothetical protein